MGHIARTLFGVCVLVMVASLALAMDARGEDLHRVIFEGHVTSASGPVGDVVAAGDTWRVEYVVDRDAPNVNTGPPTTLATYPSAIPRLTLTFLDAADGTILHGGEATAPSLQVYDGYSGEDRHLLVARSSTPPPSVGVALRTLYVTLQDEDGTAFDDQTIPTGFDLAAFERADIFYEYSFRVGNRINVARLFGTITSVSVAPLTREVDVEVSPETVNLKSKGLLTAVLYSEADFDATLASNLRLGDPTLAATVAPSKQAVEDMDADGLDDLVLKFSRANLVTAGAIDASSEALQLAGSAADGTPIRGSDAIRIAKGSGKGKP